MNNINSKNIVFMAILGAIIIVTFAYAIAFERGEKVIYTDIRDVVVKE